jgi:uncharacterized membrane protein YfcA
VPITDPWFYLVAAPAILIVSISKGGFGGGLALLGVPMMSLVIPPAQAAAIMLPILLVMDALSVWAYRGRYDRGVLATMLPGAAVGVALGGLAFGLLDAQLMRLIVGLIALAFVAQHLIGGGRLRPARPPEPWLGGICGALAGFTSTIAHAGGPPAALYLLPLRLDKTALAGTMVMLFAAINLMKLLPYAAIGQLTGLNLMTSLVLAPLAPLGVWLGIQLHRQVDETLFYRLAYGFVAITGLKLIYDAFADV